MSDPLLRVENLTKIYRGRRGAADVAAVDGVSFDVAAGETFGLVGESGCGKSTIARCVLRLVEPSGGTITFDGIDLATQDSRQMRALRARMQIVFQDATASLDPRMSVRALVEEPLRVHGDGDAAARREAAERVLELVGIGREHADRNPAAFSGGQRQRIGIARALVLNPQLVVLDEPISAVDVSLQAQILNLLLDLQDDRGLTYLLIVHDLAIAERVCDHLAVLYLGRVMELGSREQVFRHPLHPYTVSLLSAVPVPDPAREARRERIVLTGEVDPHADRAGCVFRARCPVGQNRRECAEIEPPLVPQPSGQCVACHFPGELAAT